jgi:hypothetical protein
MAILPSIGPIEAAVLLLSLAFWAGVVAFVVFVVRALRRKGDQDRTIATLVEENRRLREALDERRAEKV